MRWLHLFSLRRCLPSSQLKTAIGFSNATSGFAGRFIHDKHKIYWSSCHRAINLVLSACQDAGRNALYIRCLLHATDSSMLYKKLGCGGGWILKNPAFSQQLHSSRRPYDSVFPQAVSGIYGLFSVSRSRFVGIGIL